MRLTLPPFEPDPKDPFKDDYLNRKSNAEAITQLFMNLEDSLVMVVDGPWGVGKTTFAKMLNAHLKKVGFSTAYLDAFAVDFVEDPFLPIAAHIKDLYKEEIGANLDLQKTIMKVGARVLSKGIGIAANILTQGAFSSLTGQSLKDGKLDLSSLSSYVGDISEKIMEDKLNSFLEDEALVKTMRIQLSEIADTYYEKHQKPIVLFVDELDRCRPDFAVSFIERIKHFFAVDHVVFILVMNRTQLENAIGSTYGIGVDAKTYLEKFVNIWLNIETNSGGSSSSFNWYKHLLDFVNGPFKPNLGHFTWAEHDLLVKFLGPLQPNLRQVERFCSLVLLTKFSFGTRKGSDVQWFACIAGCILKVFLPSVYDYAIINQKSLPATTERILLYVYGPGLNDQDGRLKNVFDSEGFHRYVFQPLEEASKNFSNWEYTARFVRQKLELVTVD